MYGKVLLEISHLVQLFSDAPCASEYVFLVGASIPYKHQTPKGVTGRMISNESKIERERVQARTQGAVIRTLNKSSQYSVPVGRHSGHWRKTSHLHRSGAPSQGSVLAQRHAAPLRKVAAADQSLLWREHWWLLKATETLRQNYVFR